MLFNPLFLQVINNQESISTKTQKLSNPSYLFSDIIKVSVENELKNSMSSFSAQKVNSLGGSIELLDKQMINIPLELKSSTVFNSSVEKVIEQLINQISPNTTLENLQKTASSETIALSGTDCSKMLFEQSKIHELITNLINNKEFNGKANLVIDRQKLMQDNYSSALDEITKNDITPATLLNLLKMGNTISLESSPAEKNLGLLITLIEHNDSETNLSENFSEITDSSKTGIKHTISDPGKNSAIDNVLSNLHNVNLSGSVTYEIMISVIGQGDNISQINNSLPSDLSVIAEPENKIKVDIVLKDSTEIENNNVLNKLTELSPPEEFFASNSNNVSELSKVSSSFTNVLADDAKKLKNISQNNESLNKFTTVSVKNVLSTDANINAVGKVQTETQNLNLAAENNTVNKIFPENSGSLSSQKENISSDLNKTQLKINNPVNTKQSENSFTYNKLSDSIKVENPKSSFANNITSSNNNTETEKNIIGELNSILAKGPGNKPEIDETKIKQVKTSEQNSKIINQNIASEVIKETKGKSIEQLVNQTKNSEPVTASFNSKTTYANNTSETEKDITSKPVDFFTKNTGNQSDIKEVKFEQVKTPDGNKIDQVTQDKHPVSTSLSNKVDVSESKSEIKLENSKINIKQQVNDELKTSVTENSVSLKDQKEIADSSVILENGKKINNEVERAIINQEAKVENKIKEKSNKVEIEDNNQKNSINESAGKKDENKIKESSNKTELENNTQKLNVNLAGSKEAEKVEHQFANNTVSINKKSEKAEKKDNNEVDAKTELDNKTKVNQSISENATADDKSKENSFSDSNNKSEENKSAKEGKSANEVSFEKTFEASSKEKAGLEKGHYTDSARVVKAAELAKEISRHIQTRDKSTLYLKIDPEHLGTVKIAVNIIDNMVRANIEVENESAQKLIENNLNQLYNNLNQNGVQLNSLNISLSNFEQKHNKAYAPKKKAFGFEEDGDVDENSKTAREKSLGYNTYEYLV